MDHDTARDNAEAAKRRRGIYLLPNLFTTAGLLAAFYAIVAAMSGQFQAAAIAIFVAMVMDSLDGRVARLTNTQSDFGVQYDSLTDMVAFGAAPALVMYQWALTHMADAGWAWAKVGWLGAFIYTASAALRLARFNTQVGTVDKRYFQGLPSPAAAALVAGMVWVGADVGVGGDELMFLALLVTVTAGLLMVSRITYYSFKDVDLKHRVPFVAVLAVVLVFVLISIDPPKVLFTLALVYALSGPALAVLRIYRKRAARRGSGGA
jgi:CDP-diacylglycerol---serine O-phosphatidyltransferase